VITLHRVIDLAAPPARAWTLLWDVPALTGCLPGCQEVTELEPRRRYRATIRDRVGPFRVSIPLDVAVESVVEGERIAVAASGRDTVLGSPMKVRLAVDLVPRDGGSRLTVHGESELGGKLAALGQAVAERKTRETLDRFAENLEARLGGAPDAAAV
jgi:carbon monoxide dehydrogenase subunit G